MGHTLLPPNATQQERALEQSTKRLADIPVEIGTLWNPATCPAHLLPWLAWALSIDEWDNAWSEQTKRTTILQSASVHRHKGTVGAVKRALASLGITVSFLEWFQDVDDIALAPIHSTRPHTFVFIAWANENPYTSEEIFLNPNLYRTIQRVVNHIKPVRSHFNFLVGARISGDIKIANTVKGLQHAGFCQKTAPVQIPPSQAQLGAALHLNQRRYAVARYYFTCE